MSGAMLAARRRTLFLESLMTSRFDRGLSARAVVEIEGGER
jgi:hypothetical protein